MLYTRLTSIPFFILYLQGFSALAVEKNITKNMLNDKSELISPSLDIETNLTATHQIIDQNSISPETLYSINIALDYQVNDLGFVMMLEHSSKVESSDISDTFPEVNSDAGTTTKRTQISELLIYRQQEEGLNWQLGLAEVSALMDRSKIANDEVTQFLSAGLLNNQTIMFPDYAISTQIQNLRAFGNFGYRLLLSSGAGIDENNGNYQDLLSITSTNKGTFSAMELVSQGSNYQADFGLWQNTNTEEQDHQTGIYTSIDVSLQVGELNFRYGHLLSSPYINNDDNYEDKSNIDEFVAIAFHKGLQNGSFGLGYNISRHGESKKAINSGFIKHGVETYYRTSVNEKVFITSSLQWIETLKNGVKVNAWLPTIRLEVIL